MKQGDKHISGDSNDIHIGEATATYSVGGQTHTIHTKPSSFDVIKGDDTTATATATATTDDDTDTSDAKTQSVEDRIAYLKAKLAGSVRSGSYASSGSSSAVAVSVMLI